MYVVKFITLCRICILLRCECELATNSMKDYLSTQFPFHDFVYRDLPLQSNKNLFTEAKLHCDFIAPGGLGRRSAKDVKIAIFYFKV